MLLKEFIWVLGRLDFAEAFWFLFFVTMTKGRIRFTPCPPVLWTSVLESVLYFLQFLRWRVSRWAQVMVIVLYPTSHACKYPPDISFRDCRSLASHGTRCCISTFYNAEKTLLKMIFFLNKLENVFLVWLLHRVHILIFIIVEVAIPSVGLSLISHG